MSGPKAVKLQSPLPAISLTISKRRRRGQPKARIVRPSQSSVSSFIPNSSSTMIRLGNSVAPASRRRRRGRGYVGISRGMNAIQQYRESLANPFDNYPPSVQAGSLLPLQKRTLFTRGTVDVDGTATPYVLIVSKPGANQSLRLYKTAALGTLWSAATLALDLAPMNGATFTANAQSARTISGGLAVEIKCSSTAVPPNVYAGTVFDGIANILSASPNSLLNIPAIRVIDCSSDNIGAFATWRPFDNASMELGSRYALDWNSTVIENLSMVFLKLGASTYTINPRCVYHLESNAGLDAGGSLDDDGVILDGTLIGTVEDIARVGVNLPEPTTGTLDTILHALMDEFSARQSSRPSGLSLRSEGGLVGLRSLSAPCSSLSSQLPPSSPSVSSLLSTIARLEKRIDDLNYIKIPEL